MKEKFIKAHMQAAYIYADLSYCERKKVGSVIVKHNSIISIGYNGTPTGEDNCCEDQDGLSKPNIIHAEDNALRKLTRSHESSEGAVIFVTANPCVRCAEKIVDAGISKVYYAEVYNGTTPKGLDYLAKHSVEVEHVKI